MTGPALGVTGTPAAASAAGSAANWSRVASPSRPNPGRSVAVNSAPAAIPRAGPSQATGRVQPRRRPTAAMRLSSARSADRISRTCTTADAWRNVPQVVATGKSSVVARKVRTENVVSEAERRPAGRPGKRPKSDGRDRDPRQQEHVHEVVEEPRPAEARQGRETRGEVALEGRRVAPGEDVSPV